MRKRLFLFKLHKNSCLCWSCTNITYKLALDTLRNGTSEPTCYTTMHTGTYISIIDNVYYGHSISMWDTYCPCNFLKRFIALRVYTVCTRINYGTVSVTSLNINYGIVSVTSLNINYGIVSVTSLNINYGIVSVTSLNINLHCGTSGNEWYVYKYRCK